MKHLDFEQVRQEATVVNALIRAGVINENSKLSNDEAIELGLSELLK